MKIGFLFPQNVIGGGALVVYEHARYLKKQGHDIAIIYREYKPGRDNNFIEEFGLEYLEFDKIDINAYRFDVMIATWWETFFDIFLFNSTHYFYLTQDDERRFYENKNSFKVKFCDLTYKFPNIGAITISGWWQKQLIKEGNPYTKVVPNGYDSKLLTASNRKPSQDRKLRVLIEGPGEVWFRRIDDSFKAVEGLDDIEVWFKSRGRHVDPSWRYDKIFYNVSPQEMADIYSQCDVLLKMSEVEAFCLPNLEMMATGGTIITTDFTGHEEYAVNNHNAIVIAKRDMQAARNAVIKLRDDRALLGNLQQNALKTAQTMTWEMQTPKFEKALNELIAQFKGHDYAHDKEMILRLRDIKLSVEILEKSNIKLEADYKNLFAQHHRNEYRLLRFIGRIIYRIPILGSIIRSIFTSKEPAK